MKILLNKLLIVGLLGSLVSLGGLLSAHHLLFDLLAHFRIQYIVLILGLICLAFGLRRYWIALVLILCLSTHANEVITSQLPADSVADADGPTIRVMSSNLLASNTQYEEYVRYISDIDPDVIVFQEYTKAWAKALESSLPEYEHKLSIQHDGPFSIAVFSKLPFHRVDDESLANARRPSVDVVVSIANSELRIIGTHPPPPMSQQLFMERNKMLQALADVTKIQFEPLVVLGDFNTTPWSYHFRELIINGQLLDGRRGLGILPTWPANFFPLQIPIDHILLNDGARVVNMQTSTGLSSDHRTIWADLQLK